MKNNKSKRIYLTPRDKKMLDFLSNTNGYITAEQASRFIYKTANKTKERPTNEEVLKDKKKKKYNSSLRVAQRRLEALVLAGELSRHREFVGQPYIYYYGKTKKITKYHHKLLITEFIVRMHEKYKVIEYKTEFLELQSKYTKRPDIYMVFDFYGFRFSVLVECEVSNTFNNKVHHYFKILDDRRNKKLTEVLPHYTFIIPCCSEDKKPKVEHPNFIWINSDFSNFVNLEYKLIKLTDAAKKQTK